jgi:hypothetical protein
MADVPDIPPQYAVFGGKAGTSSRIDFRAFVENSGDYG